MENFYLKDETYQIIGLCMEVHKILGKGHSEIIYGDALEYEFKKSNIPFEREKEFSIEYKGNILPHKFYADFIIYDEIILEIKTVKEINLGCKRLITAKHNNRISHIKR